MKESFVIKDILKGEYYSSYSVVKEVGKIYFTSLEYCKKFDSKKEAKRLIPFLFGVNRSEIGFLEIVKVYY